MLDIFEILFALVYDFWMSRSIFCGFRCLVLLRKSSRRPQKRKMIWMCLSERLFYHHNLIRLFKHSRSIPKSRRPLLLKMLVGMTLTKSTLFPFIRNNARFSQVNLTKLLNRYHFMGPMENLRRINNFLITQYI